MDAQLKRIVAIMYLLENKNIFLAYLEESRQWQYTHAEIGRPETGKAKDKPDILQVSSDSNKSFKDQSKI